MNAKYIKNIHNNELVSDDLPVEDRSEQYLGDFFKDDKYLVEEMEPYEYLMDTKAANEDIWDLLDIDESTWDEASEGGFLIP